MTTRCRERPSRRPEFEGTGAGEAGGRRRAGRSTSKGHSGKAPASRARLGAELGAHRKGDDDDAAAERFLRH